MWTIYHDSLKDLEERGYLRRPYVPSYCQHNGHMYAIRVNNLEIRTKLLAYLKARGIGAVFHYVPLHTARAGKKWGIFNGEDHYTTSESEKLIRLPMYYGLTQKEINDVVNSIYDFFSNDNF